MKKRIANLLLITLYVNILMLCFGTVEAKADGIGTRTYWNGYSFYILSYSCWDSGGHIDWEYQGSKYGMNVSNATEMWNTAAKSVSLSRCKSIFRKDTWKTVCDVTIKDCNKKDGINASLTIDSLGFGVMSLNAYYMNDYNQNIRNAIIAHELGHALGIGDDYSQSDYIMYGYTPKVTYITNRDKAALQYEMRNHTTYFG